MFHMLLVYHDQQLQEQAEIILKLSIIIILNMNVINFLEICENLPQICFLLHDQE